MRVDGGASSTGGKEREESALGFSTLFGSLTSDENAEEEEVARGSTPVGGEDDDGMCSPSPLRDSFFISRGAVVFVLLWRLVGGASGELWGSGRNGFEAMTLLSVRR
uniref:Uncharacterized protein n=1 Tax=Chromera velia CCMP2878 TaxID=1169474 RepID=A0A0G4HSD0_9ALVE|eukprot:Cvel_31035.t1-p1 / transcript=Cvel_31035.t1 / gene=Cvel_31035 / organism=Chromera_velia_CCMP2878 / gene_product=hypothetical protein / transcript_product=hypothetical protein / location=Cvel_scaffold4544:6540-7323(-) / protein_length=106 / sequence_SO=supercontig / SO=protein_coding / is_pseudo=false